MAPSAMRKPKQQQKPINDLRRSLAPFDPNQTLIAKRAGSLPGSSVAWSASH
jgi:hypothetical protein